MNKIFDKFLVPFLGILLIASGIGCLVGACYYAFTGNLQLGLQLLKTFLLGCILLSEK